MFLIIIIMTKFANFSPDWCFQTCISHRSLALTSRSSSTWLSTVDSEDRRSVPSAACTKDAETSAVSASIPRHNTRLARHSLLVKSDFNLYFRKHIWGQQTHWTCDSFTQVVLYELCPLRNGETQFIVENAFGRHSFELVAVLPARVLQARCEENVWYGARQWQILAGDWSLNLQKMKI